MPETRLLDLMSAHLRALYVHDRAGRITAINQWTGGPVPRFHLARTSAGHLWRFRSDLPDDLVAELEAPCAAEPLPAVPEHPPRYRDRYESLLAAHAPIEQIWTGPAFSVPERVGIEPAEDDAMRTVEIEQGNAGLLSPRLLDWRPDVPHRQPLIAAVDDGEAVAVCASARITHDAHEAGVETHSRFRHQGHGSRVVAAWARAVRRTGALPLYSTSWDNQASLALAASLSLDFIGSDYHVR